MDDSGTNQLCELCERRLSKVKHHRAYGVGRICNPRCKLKKNAVDQPATPAAATATAVTPLRKRKRADSDPGQPQNLSRLRTRAPRPAIIPPVKKARFKADPIDILALLDQTHARRMALLEEDAKIGIEFGGTD